MARGAARSVLIITSVFPPDVNPAVYRTAKFVKHLPGLGWRPVVLCVGPRRKATARDEALIHEIPGGIPVEFVGWDPLRPLYKAGSRVLGRPGLGADWGRLRSALRHARRLCRQHGVDAIVACSPPKRLPLLGAWLKRETGLPVVHDFQDPPWQLEAGWSPRSNQRGYFERQFGEVFHGSDRLIANTEAARDAIVGRLGVPSERVVCIPNGFDEDDFAGQCAARDAGGTLHALCAGRLYPNAEGAALAQALEIAARRPDFRARFRLRVLSDAERAAAGRLASPALSDLVGFRDPVDHRAAVASMLRADLNVALCPARSSALRIPQKLFEYLRAGRPILALMGPGPGRALVEDLGVGIACDPKSAEQMAEGLLRAFDRWKAGWAPPPIPREKLRRFERRQLARQLVALLDDLLEARPAGQRFA